MSRYLQALRYRMGKNIEVGLIRKWNDHRNKIAGCYPEK